jgi:hypothetical protein
MQALMMQVFYCEGVSGDDLDALLAWGEGEGTWPWLYGEAETGLLLQKLADARAEWKAWRHGRAFGPAAELDWWEEEGGRYRGRYRLRFLAASVAPPDDPALPWSDAEEWDAWDDEPAVTLLHGTYDRDRSQTQERPSWSEARIPRWLHYPVDVPAADAPEALRAVLVSRAYAQNGIVGLNRLIEIRTEIVEVFDVS